MNWRWAFENETRLKIVTAALTVTAILLGCTVLAHRLSGLAPAPAPAPALPTVAATTEEPVSSDLLPPSVAPDGPSPTQDYGSSAAIAMEAVSAFLKGDRVGFSRLAQQEAVEAVNEAPTPDPGQEVTGAGEIILGGPTQQDVRVPTTDAPLRLTMIIVDGAWKVLDMRYER